MTVLNQTKLSVQALEETARRMAVAARTAPKTNGKDTLEIAVITEATLEKLAVEMERIAKEHHQAFFARDARNLRQSGALLLIGTKFQAAGVDVCGYCGYSNCEEKRKHPDVPCAFNTTDLGIATGSAVSIAADARVDNRIMYTVGLAARNLKLMAEEVRIIYGIPLSASGKNPFFDRK